MPPDSCTGAGLVSGRCSGGHLPLTSKVVARQLWGWSPCPGVCSRLLGHPMVAVGVILDLWAATWWGVRVSMNSAIPWEAS